MDRQLQTLKRRSVSEKITIWVIVTSSFFFKDPLMNSRNVPILLSRNLTTPLSVNVDNQTVPHCGNIISLPDHLSPDTRKHLIGPFTSSGDGGTTPIVSPTTSAMVSFDGFDYDGSTNLLEVGPDLLGNLLLDRNLVWSIAMWFMTLQKITRGSIDQGKLEIGFNIRSF